MRILLPFAAVITLSACETVNSVFESEEPPRMEGERISVLELQSQLQPSSSETKIITPRVWNNEFWPQSGGYPGHVLGNLALGAPPLSVLWTAQIGEGSTSQIPLNATPIIVDGKAFTLDTNFAVSAFDIADGNRLWTSNIQSNPDDDIVIAGGLSYSNKVLFVTNGYNDIIALNPETGEQLWKKDTGAPSRAAPTIIEGRLFVVTLDNRLLALDEKTGELLWEYTGIGESAGLFGAASPAANDDIVIPVFSSGEISALRIENGSLAWSDNLSNIRRGGGIASISDIRAMPVLDDNLVFSISFAGRLAAIDQRTGVRTWQHQVGGSQMPWVAGDFIYVITGDNQLIAIEKTKGDIIWVQALPSYGADGAVQWFGPVMADGQLLVTNNVGDLIFHDAQTGDVSLEENLGINVVGAPIIAGKILYVLSEEGLLVALTGQETKNSDKQE